MSDTKVVLKGQVYDAKEDAKTGAKRSITIERTVMAKRVYDKKKELYAVGVSRIESAPHGRADQIGKKRRVFLKVSRLLSYEYSLRPEPAPAAGVESHHDARNIGHGHVNKRPDGHVARCGGPAICSPCATEKAVAEKPTGELHIESVPGL